MREAKPGKGKFNVLLCSELNDKQKRNLDIYDNLHKEQGDVTAEELESNHLKFGLVYPNLRKDYNFIYRENKYSLTESIMTIIECSNAIDEDTNIIIHHSVPEPEKVKHQIVGLFAMKAFW